MKSKILSIILVIGILLSMMAVPSFAEGEFSEQVNFTGFLLNYNTDDVPNLQYGTFSRFGYGSFTGTYPTSNYYSFNTNTTEADANGDGTSLEMWIHSGASSQSAYPGISYTLNNDTVINNVFHFNTAIKIPDYAAGVPTRIDITGASLTTPTTLFYIENSGGNLIFKVWDGSTANYVKNGSAYVNLPEDEWFTVDIAYDLVNNDIKYTVSTANEVLYKNTFDTAVANANIAAGINAVHIWCPWQFKTLKSKLGDYAQKRCMYLDNMSIENLNEMPAEPYVKTDAVYEPMDFNDFVMTWATNANLTNNLPSTQYGTFSRYGDSSSWKDYGIYTFAENNTISDADGDSTSLEMWVKSYTINANPGLSYTLNDRTVIQDILYFKTSLYMPDYGSSYPVNISVQGPKLAQPLNLVAIDNTGATPVFGVYNGQSTEYPRKDGSMISLSEEKWINIEIWFDLADNNIKYKLSDKDGVIYQNTFTDAAVNENIAAGINAVHIWYPWTFPTMKSKLGTDVTRKIYFDDFLVDVVDSMNEYAVPNLKMSDISFTDSYDAPLSYIKGGDTVKASFTASASNDASFNMLYCMAVYKNSELVAIDTKEVAVDAIDATHTLTVTAPNVVNPHAKVFIWDKASLTPYFNFMLNPVAAGTPIAIVKLDDVQVNDDTYMSKFTGFADWAKGNDINFGAGLIASSLETATNTQINTFKTFAAKDNVEIWFHGYENPSTSDLTFNREKSTQKEDFDKGIAIAKEKANITFTAFNPPSNTMNADTVALINESYPQIEAVMKVNYNGSNGLALTGARELYSAIKVEPTATSETDTLDKLKALWSEKATSAKYIMLQAHPGAWDNFEGSEDRFKDFLLWLKSEGVVFMTPTEYVRYAKSIGNN